MRQTAVTLFAIPKMVVFGLAGLVLMAGLIGPGKASANTEVMDFVRQLVDETLTAARSGEAGSDQDETLRGILRKGFAVPQIGKSAVGKTFWGGANTEQRERFLGAFEDYILRTYASRLNSFEGDVNFLEAVDGRITVVKSTVNLPGVEDPIAVDWKVVNSPIGLKVFDLQIEGTSMLKTFRSEFGAVLKKNRGDLDKLTEELGTKTVTGS